MEKLYYEIRPLAFIALAMYALLYKEPNTILTVSGWLLMGCVGLILFARYSHRKLNTRY